jgi:hypothetical protein
MAQHDYIISNQTFPNTRADINNVLQAIATNNSGTSAPTTLYAGQFWLDTNTPSSTTWTLYIHDGTDNIQFAQIDTSANTVNFIDSALASDVVISTSGAVSTTGAFTTTPGVKLEIKGADGDADAQAIRLMENSTQGGFIKYDGNANELQLGGFNSGENTGIRIARNDATTMFNTNGAERMRIDRFW